uniref:Uncharacterized protein n=1 Tax=Anser cygnoides TaxID=8845 RepID=A0A8B9EK31_ANSCY
MLLAKPRKGHSDRGIFGAAAKGCLSELEKTLKDNDINALNSSRETLLHVAATNGHLAIMEYLISKGAKPDVKDKKGRTPLHRAAEKGHGDAVKVLLRCGASMYSLDKEGKMPLHVAAQNSHGHILKSGASIDGKDGRGQTALSYALSRGIKSVIKRGHRKSQKPYLKHSICHVQIYYSYFFVLINPVTRLDIIQPGEWWGPKTLLPECCCLQGTTGCCTNVQYWPGPLCMCVIPYLVTLT